MKKVIALFVLLMFLGMNVQAATLGTAISKYKRQNYAGCITDLNDMLMQMSKTGKDTDLGNKVISAVAQLDTEKIEKGDFFETAKLTKEMSKIAKFRKTDTDKWAYIFYYYALALHQIGAGNPRGYYETAAKFSAHSKIGEYSKQAIQCLDSPDSCQSSDMDEFIRSGKQVDDSIIRQELKNDLEKHKNNINSGKDLSLAPQKEEKLAWADEGIPAEISEIGRNETNNNAPTDEEIGHAIRTLQKAGLNPLAYNNMPVNNEYAQLNALLNSGDDYTNSYYSPMMMNGNSGQLSPEVMQTILRQQMMGGFGSF